MIAQKICADKLCCSIRLRNLNRFVFFAWLWFCHNIQEENYGIQNQICLRAYGQRQPDRQLPFNLHLGKSHNQKLWIKNDETPYRALYYEIQYRNAIVSDLFSFYSIDFSAPANFTEFFKRCFELQIPDNLKSVYTDFINILSYVPTLWRFQTDK